MSFFSEERANELRAIFFESAQELLQALNEEGLRLEKTPSDPEIVREIRRTVHTLKGDSAACGYRELSELAHALEDVLTIETALRAGTALAELVLSAADNFEEFLAAYTSDMQPPSGEPLRNMVRRIMSEETSPSPELPVPSFAWNEYERLVIAKTAEPGRGVLNVGLVVDPKCAMPTAALQLISNVLQEVGTVLVTHPESEAAGPVEIVEAAVATEHTPEWIQNKCSVPGVVVHVYVAPIEQTKTGEGEAAAPPEQNPQEKVGELQAEMLHAGTEPSTPTGALSLEGSETKQDRPKNERSLPATENLLRVDAERIDTVLDLVGELIIARSTLQQVLADMTRSFPKHPIRNRFADTLAKQSQVMHKLQRSVMKIRMVPVEQLFRRFPRIVRDLAKTENKDVQLVLEGENTDLDKSILDALAEPLTHLVRNAVDHGIESSELRSQRGKPGQGTIRLNAYHQGNHVVIEVSDDGGGIDHDRMKSKAIEKGLLTPDQAAKLTDHDALSLVFEPGLSTAEHLTEISGRGVGMDIVRAVIDRLKGSISIDTEIGVGTTFQLRLPLTLAIIKALLFRSADRLYAVPLGSVLEIARAFEHEVHFIDEHEVLRIRDEVIPIVRLNRISDSTLEQECTKFFVVVVSSGDRKFGLVVDKLIGEEELVIKALEDQLVATDLVGGASVLGDGRVVLILSLSAVVDRLARCQSSTKKQAVNA